MLIEMVQKLFMFATQRLLFVFLASLVETDIKISLFFMDTHQGPEGRRNLITCWKMEGSQCEIVKMLAVIIQVSWSAQYTWTGIECFPVTDFAEMGTDAEKESEQSTLAKPSRLWVIPGQGPHSPLIVVCSTQHLLSTKQCWMERSMS